MARLGEKDKFYEIVNQSIVIEKGPPTRYRVKTRKGSQSEPFRKMTFGERDETKPHKTILMVGETGTGKTKLINTMINYMLDVQREDKVWFEITDDQSDRTSVHSQTSIITVYGFYPRESKTDLTIIDTPGYGDTQAVNEKAMSVLKTVETIDKLDAVCLVIKATQTRLTDKQIYVFDAVQSLFGRDIAENIVLLLTSSRGAIPKNILTAVEEAKVKCAVDEQNQPLYFLFDNCQGETFHEEYQMTQKQSWDLSFRGITGLFEFLYTIKPKSLEMTQDVLQQREQLEQYVSKIQSHIKKIDKKQNELKDSKKITDVVEVHKETDTDTSVANEATCCIVCEENCHYSGWRWACNLLWCSAERDNYCTVCTNKSSYKEYVNDVITNEPKAEKRLSENLEKENVTTEDSMLIQKLEKELQELEKEKLKLVMDAFHCVDTLEMIALNTDSLNTLQHVDFLIEKLKEINEPKKAEILENIKKRAGEYQNNVPQHMKICVVHQETAP